MIKKIIISLILFFSIYFNVNAWTEYIWPSIWWIPIYWSNDWPDNQYYFTYTFATPSIMNLYNNSGTILNSVDSVTFAQLDNTYKWILFKWKNYIIYSRRTYANDYIGLWYLWLNSIWSPFYWLKNSAPSIFIKNWILYKYWNSTNTYYYDQLTGQFILWPYINIPQSSYHSLLWSYEIIYSNSEQNIYYDRINSKYFLEWIDGYWYYNFEIFNNFILGSELEKLNLDPIYKNNIIYSKFYSYVNTQWIQNYYLSNCYSTWMTYTINWLNYLSNNLTFRWFLEPWISLPSWFNFIDNKFYKNVYNWNWLKQLNYLDFNKLWYECNPTLTFWGFNWNVPAYIQYIRSWFLYKYVFWLNEVINYTWDNNIWWISSIASNFSTWTTITDDQVVNWLFDFDIDNDWVVSIWEYTLAPFTFIKNVVIQLNESIKSIWSFLKAIMNIWNIAFIPNAYASSWILLDISNKTSDFTSWNIPEMGVFYNIYNIIKYWSFFWIFFLILFIFIYLRFYK